ncbi:hypothetical protein KCP69_10090 [Salmonella enterica subsp. enterica]|nr:hypothetical protein KCP69_10090 [Salmonella enterica subsp. enterica]
MNGTATPLRLCFRRHGRGSHSSPPASRGATAGLHRRRSAMVTVPDTSRRSLNALTSTCLPISSRFIAMRCDVFEDASNSFAFVARLFEHVGGSGLSGTDARP